MQEWEQCGGSTPSGAVETGAQMCLDANSCKGLFADEKAYTDPIMSLVPIIFDFTVLYLQEEMKEAFDRWPIAS